MSPTGLSFGVQRYPCCGGRDCVKFGILGPELLHEIKVSVFCSELSLSQTGLGPSERELSILYKVK